MYKIKKASEAHIRAIAQLAYLLWPDEEKRLLLKEMRRHQADSTAELFVCDVDAQVVGFAYVQLRYDYVEGTISTPVAYLEGLYVSQGYQNKGIGKQLVEVCEDWARFMNASELASDVEVGNEAGAAFHNTVGFKEVNRVICYAKKL